MMSRYRWTLLKQSQQWLVTRSDGEQTASLETTAVPHNQDPAACSEALASSLLSAGYDGSGVLVVIDSLDCLAVSAAVDESVMSGGRNAVIYELEQYLPFPSEEFTVDYLEHSKSLFAVVVKTAEFQSLLESLENKGVFVQSLVPSALIVAQFLWEHVQESRSENGEADHALLWRDNGRLECVLLDQKGPLAWHALATEMNALCQMLEAHAWRADRTVVVHAFDTDLMSSHDLREHSRIAFRAMDRPIVAPVDADAHGFARVAAVRAADEILSGKSKPWIDLRRGSLGSGDFCRPVRRSLRFAMSGVIALMIAVSAVFWMRSQQYVAMAKDFQSRQAEAFHMVLPNQKVQTGFRGRMESEYKRLSGLKGEEGEMPHRVSSLISLYRLLHSMPSELRFRFLEMRFEQDHVSLEGQVRAHSDADTIAVALREGGFRVESPSTQILSEQGVAVRMTAQWSDRP